jgi:cytochrome P450
MPELIRFALDPLSTLMDLRDRYGDIVRLGYGKAPAVIVFSPDFNREILRDPSIFYSYNLDLLPIRFPKDSVLPRVMNSMPFLNGEKHRDHRSYLLPSFHRSFITRHHAACVAVTERKLSAWRIGDVIDMREEMEQLAMWLATKPILGLEPEKEGEELGRQIDEFLKLLFSPLSLLLPYNIPGLPFQRLFKRAERLENLVRMIVERRRAKGAYGDDILSALIQFNEQAPERMSEADILAQTIMFRGGYSPNGMALYWTIFLLSQHPEVLAKVREELSRALGGGNPSPEELENLPYLECEIKETLRLFPAGVWTGRYATQPFELGPYRLPKGTWVLLSAYVTHRIPEVFPEPYKFIPERWQSIHPSSYEFMSFSAGPRYCIGAPLAIMQLKIALSMILQRHDLSPRPGIRLDSASVNSIRPRNGMPMIVAPVGKVSPRIPVSGNIHRIVDLH